MANPIHTAQRREAATNRLLRAVRAIEEKEETGVTVGGTSRDPDVRQAELLESTATLLERMADIEEPEPYELNHTPSAAAPHLATPDPGTTPAASESLSYADGAVTVNRIEPAKPVAKLATDEEGDDEDDEPTFHGFPLSHFKSMSDDDILDIEGIGPGTLKKIREAQEAE